ncbi:hypothetical protein SPBR_01149 [Sporothrix brasiliensis 5110]|uniref:Uncharacterized protein n=1 Tax=Sporothrix brasiliensis 5110 TaxID=1398154 RepID=A0A0C2FH78_9PEZI|nr:uncharacterized protein SPBR_01149 [Sporothrix brasiliensis 5110]KIH90448.1 hypothetical protein SPBR_01149 [Sporothrix brasiliensis 5110]
MLSICSVQMSLTNWDVAGSALKAAVRLNVWLGDTDGSNGEPEKGAGAGGSMGREEVRSGLAQTVEYVLHGVSGFSTTEHHELRDRDAIFPGWNQ